jgi:hypothetical protein
MCKSKQGKQLCSILKLISENDNLLTPKTIPELLKAQGMVIAPVPTMEVQTEKIIVNAPCFFSLSIFLWIF